MSGNSWSRLPLEIRTMVYTNVLRGEKYIIADPEADFRYPSGVFRYHVPNYRPPAYAGLLLASEEISTELQEVLYKTCVFRAYLCEHSDRALPSPDSQVFARLQKVEFYLDLHTYRQIPSGRMRDPKRYYREWFEVFGGSGNHRNYCRVTFSNIAFEDWLPTNDLVHTVLYQQFIQACKTFVGFQTVILELGGAPSFHLRMLPDYQAATGPAQDPVYAGAKFEALKMRLAMELEPFLGPCIYYDRGIFCCLEFRPGDAVNPIQPGQAPFVNPVDS